MSLAQGHNAVMPLRLEPAAPYLELNTLPLSHCPPQYPCYKGLNAFCDLSSRVHTITKMKIGMKNTQIVMTNSVYGPRRKKTCLREFANNKGADQPVHSRSMISTFIVRSLESNISKLATDEISIF